MGLWTGIKSLFGSSKAVDDVLDKDNGLLTQAGEWIGNFNYTDEEKAESRAKMNEGVVEYVRMTLTENTVRSRTRRYIAISWIKIELFLVLLTCSVAPWDIELAKFYWSVATSELMFWGTMSVIGFFFGPYMIGQHFGKPKSK